MRRIRLVTALCAALALPVALACGPDFPNEVLSDRAHTLAHLPEGAFQVEVARLVPRPKVHFVPAEQANYWDPDDALRSQREAAERADLSESERRLVATMRAQDSPSAAYAAGVGLDEDIRHYVAGAVAWGQGQHQIAREHFEFSLEANATPAARRASWAQYMLARIGAQRDGVDASAAAYAKVRSLVVAGAPDPLGLAVASFGEEAWLHLEASPIAALNLYLQQAATGSMSGANSALMMARAAFADEASLQAWVADPLARRVAVVYAFSRASELSSSDANRDTSAAGGTSSFERLLDAIEASPMPESAGLDRLAAAAYRAGRFDLAERLVAHASSALSAWVSAKLALRRGDRDAAARAYAEAAARFPTDETWTRLHERGSGREFLQPQCQVQAELGVLNLARADYVAAMEALYAAGGQYWMDAQYVADRVLTLDELRVFVATHAASAAMSANAPRYNEGGGYGDVAPLLRALFARRLMRAGMFDEALPYFADDESRRAAQRYGAAVRRAQGGGFWFDRVGRAEAWFEAATIARHSGMELFATEGPPDFRIWGGYYGRQRGRYVEGKWIAEPATDIELAGDWIGADEARRLSASRPSHLSRFHYRELAADQVMQAANFVPARSQAFAAMLCEGTGWLLDSEPEAARVLYRRYVREGALVPFGATFGRVCPAPAFDRARERLKFERLRSAKIALHRYGPYAAATLMLLVGAWFWRRRHAPR